MRARRWRALKRTGLGLLAVGALAVGALTMDAWTAMGTTPSGERLARVRRSPQYGDDRFVNRLPMASMDAAGMLAGWWNKSEHARPREALATVRPRFAEVPADLRITWLGHSTLLIELDGHRVLTDPVFSERSGPSSFMGPTRFHPPPIPLAELPPLDAVVISHDHYDHLDAATIAALAARVPRFVVPLGVGAHLAYWGVEEARVVELDWWDEAVVGDLRLVATPARHFSGRGLLDRDRTLWASWAIVGPEHRVFFSGDTGMHPGFAEIGERLGPFDATMIEVGAYDSLWRDVHLGPEQAVQAHRLLRGRLMLPVHWGTFDLGLHSWVEPAERFVRAAEAASIAAAVPRPGESVDPATPPLIARWWSREVPWRRAELAPVVASHLPSDLFDVAALARP